VWCCIAFTGLACAGITAEEDSLRPEEKEQRGFLYSHKSRGFRHYLPATYILVYTDNAGGIVTKSLTLPDTSRRMSVRPHTFLASNDLELSFARGILGSAKSDADATAVPKALIAAAEKVAIAAAKQGMLTLLAGETAPPTRRFIPGPYLFKLVLQPDGSARLLGDGGVELLVAIPPKAPPKSGGG
jgi:hypothetical protein